jgi:glyoxylase-like metal-dependent hydrolase (beta-lactamase superfamily II)
MHSASRQRVRTALDWLHGQTTLAPCGETGHCLAGQAGRSRRPIEGGRPMALDYDVIVKGHNLSMRDGFFGLANVTLVSTPDGPVLFDTGHYCNRPALLKGLAKRGVEPSAVKAVFLSHLRFDHSNNIDLFPDAKVYVSKKEWEYAKKPHKDDIFMPWLIHEMLGRYTLDLLDGESRLARGILSIPAPGHTPGSYALVLEGTPKGRVVLAGDAIKYPKEALNRRSDMVFDTVENSRTTIERLLSLGDRIVPGHFPELVKRGESFTWEEAAEFPLMVR